jgi:hypothetical protein
VWGWGVRRIARLGARFVVETAPSSADASWRLQ